MNEYDEIDAHRDRLLELRSGSVIGPVHIEIDGQEGFRYFPELLPNYRARKRRILLRAKEILEDLHPMTVRQVYYRLVVEGFPAVVVNDAYGEDLYERTLRQKAGTGDQG